MVKRVISSGTVHYREDREAKVVVRRVVSRVVRGDKISKGTREAITTMDLGIINYIRVASMANHKISGDYHSC